LEEPELQNSGQRALLCTPPLPSPTRTITFITPYAVKARPRSVSDGQASRGAVVAHDGCLTPVKSEPHDDDDDEMEGVHHQQSPPTAGLRHQLPPSPDFPSPPATTMFLYYRPAKVKREGHDSVLMAHHEPSPVGANNNTKAEVKKEKEKSLDSSSSTLNSSEFERERERLERELEQEVLKAVNAQQSPASLPPTSTFHFGMSWHAHDTRTAAHADLYTHCRCAFAVLCAKVQLQRVHDGGGDLQGNPQQRDAQVRLRGERERGEPRRVDERQLGDV
jgi:hypothetical protein